MIHKKRIHFVALALALLMAVLFCQPAFAAEKSINSINIDVALQPDGSAAITEVWEVSGIYDGTEYYIALDNMGAMTVDSLEVRDETGTRYETLDKWTENRSLEQKAYTCGVLQTSSGYEICWGMNSYADHTYIVRYVIHGLVNGFDDAAGFNHEFVTNNLSSPPRKVSVNVHMYDIDFSVENAGIWAFGFNGEIQFTEDGSIRSWSHKRFGADNYMTVMCRFDSDLFTPALTQGGSFDRVVESAFRDSDYSLEDYYGQGGEAPPKKIQGWKILLFVLELLVLLFLVVCMVVLIYVIVISAGRAFSKGRIRLSDGSKVKVPRVNKVNYAREIPYGGSLPATYYALLESYNLPQNDGIIGCYLLRWYRAKLISFTNLSGMKNEAGIVLCQSADNLPSHEATLFSLLESAAGYNGVLNEGELKNWSRTHYSSITGWTHELRQLGKQKILQMDQAVIPQKKSVFDRDEVHFTPEGFQKIAGVLGFWKYLKDFTIINERQPVEVELWDDYLVV